METINFREHKIRKVGKYKCKCGHKFKRVENTSWTENPFNKLWVAGKVKELNEKCEKQLEEYLKEKKCPKCNSVCNLIS